MNLAIKEEECTICLEAVTFSNTIGKIKNCHHYYHEDCILQWSSHSNSCPTCRKLFYRIDVSRHGEPNKIRKLISIRDKLLPNDAIDQIPQEYIIPTNYPSTDRENSQNTLDQITEHYSSNNKLCSICSSSDYRSSLSRNLIYCNNCPSAFHLNCLGVNAYEEFDDLTWCCPMCDSLQDLSAMPTYQSGVASNRSRSSRGAGNIRPGANRIRTPRTATSLLNSHLTDAIFRNASVPINIVPRVDNLNVTPERTSRENSRRRPGLIIHNENGELDDDFLYDASNIDDQTNTRAENNRAYSPPIINGGVILRKELKEKQKLSKEEAQSWDVFEEARKCKVDSESPNLVQSIAQKVEEPRARRRRKKLSDIPHSNSELIEGTSAKLQNVPEEKRQEKTRISSLISQLRSHQTGCKYERKTATSHGIPTTPDASTGISLNPTESISGDSGALSDSETKVQRKKACIDKPASMELSLEQKVEIQKHIRNNLRPLYRPGESNPSHSPTIRSEEIYIEINKSASRKIYAHILSLITSETGQLKSSILVDYFNEDETKLKSIVEKFVQDELSYYKW